MCVLFASRVQCNWSVLTQEVTCVLFMQQLISCDPFTFTHTHKHTHKWTLLEKTVVNSKHGNVIYKGVREAFNLRTKGQR